MVENYPSREAMREAIKELLRKHEWSHGYIGGKAMLIDQLADVLAQYSPISMQDVRLVAGEGYIAPPHLLKAVNIILKQRAERHLVAPAEGRPDSSASDDMCQCVSCGRMHRRLGKPPLSVMEQIARDMREGTFPRKSEKTLQEMSDINAAPVAQLIKDLTTIVTLAEKNRTLKRLKSVAVYFDEAELRAIIAALSAPPAEEVPVEDPDHG